jgi:hypothetical protein
VVEGRRLQWREASQCSPASDLIKGFCWWLQRSCDKLSPDAKPTWISPRVMRPDCNLSHRRALSLWREDIPATVIVTKKEDHVR